MTVHLALSSLPDQAASLPSGTGVGVGTLVAVLLGLGLGVGLLLLLTAGRSTAPYHRPHPWTRRLRVERRVLRGLAAAGVAAVLAGVLTVWVAAGVLAGLATAALPRLLGADREHSRRVGRMEAIAAWAEMLRDTLAAAAGLEQAILATAELAPAPIRGQLQALAARLEQGQRLVPALRGLADELADPTADLVVAALVMAAERHPRHLADLLGALARAAREQAAMRRRIHTARARTRTSVRVIVATTCAFAAVLVLFNRPYLQAYDTPAGQLVLLGIAALFAAGFAWLARMAQLPEPARVLSPITEDTGGSPTHRQGLVGP